VAGLPSLPVTTERQTAGAARHWAPHQGPTEPSRRRPTGARVQLRSTTRSGTRLKLTRCWPLNPSGSSP